MMYHSYRQHEDNQYPQDQLIEAHAEYIRHLENRQTEETSIQQRLTTTAKQQHEERKEKIKKTRHTKTTNLDSRAWLWWERNRPIYKTNQPKGRPKHTQFTSNGILQRRHASGNNSCLFNAIINNIVHMIRARLELPEAFQEAFTVGLGTYKQTSDYYQSCEGELERMMSEITNFAEFKKATKAKFKKRTKIKPLDDRNLETIGNAVLRQMVINAHTQLAIEEVALKAAALEDTGLKEVAVEAVDASPHMRRATKLIMGRNKIQGDDFDLSALQKATDLQFEHYEQSCNDTIVLNVFLATNNQLNKATIRLIHIQGAAGEEHLNHFDWLQVIAKPQPIAACKTNHLDAQVENDYNCRDYTPDEAQALAATKHALQRTINDGADGADQNLLNAYISAITYALSTHAIQQEHEVLATKLSAANSSAEALSSAPHAFVNNKLTASSHKSSHIPNI